MPKVATAEESVSMLAEALRRRRRCCCVSGVAVFNAILRDQNIQNYKLYPNQNTQVENNSHSQNLSNTTTWICFRIILDTEFRSIFFAISLVGITTTGQVFPDKPPSTIERHSPLALRKAKVS